MLLLCCFPLGFPHQNSKQENLSNVTYSNAEMFNKNSLYRKAEPQAPVYSNISGSNTYNNVPSYANIGKCLFSHKNGIFQKNKKIYILFLL